MKIGGKVEGITTDKISQLENAAKQHRKEVIAAIIEYYAANNTNGRAIADQKIREAYKNAISAEKQRDGLQEIQADAQASKQQIADWAKLV